jgi:hypothetical protein
MKPSRRTLGSLMLVSASLCGLLVSPCGAGATELDNEGVIHEGSGRVPLAGDPFAVVSQTSLFASLEVLTSIRPHAGWRTSATTGEVRALEYVEGRLGALGFLRSIGLELERQSFNVYFGTELHETRLELEVAGVMAEVAADGMIGDRDRLPRALRYDSDGQLNDVSRDPVVVEGAVVVVRSATALAALTHEDVAQALVFVDYAVIDRSILDTQTAGDNAWRLLTLDPAGIVVVTSFSNQRGTSHGTFSRWLSSLTWFEEEPSPPTLVARLEDFAPAGVSSWDDLQTTDRARLTWDADVLSPARSGLLAARIPGVDPSLAVILGAHIDSPNTPGALDNGSGSVVLLEVAKALDRSRVRPPVDVYLVWFGSHERGLYGSQNFVASHSELLDRALAMFQIDCLSRPIDGISAYLNLEGWSYTRFGNGSLPWPQYMEQVAVDHDIVAEPLDYLGITSDNSSFAGSNVPHLNLIYMNPYEMTEVHYDGHLHDPYDDLPLALEEAATLENMATLALAAALETGRDQPVLRVTPQPDRRALFVASHTEAPHMTPSALIDFGMALAWMGFDVDTIPYGQPVTSEDLGDCDLVIVLPVHDYPSLDGDVSLYDEAWSSDEIDALEDYTRGGGLLVLTNSAHRMKYLNTVYEDNEDWQDVNDLGSRFGVAYSGVPLHGASATTEGVHGLVSGVGAIRMATDNGIGFTIAAGQVLARADGQAAVAVVPAGAGEVVVLADLGMLGNGSGTPQNLRFWENLGEHARSR